MLANSCNAQQFYPVNVQPYRYILAWEKSETASQAAITLVSPVQNILINFGAGITTAGSILISQYLGARQDKQANSMANHICLCSLVFAVICAGIMLDCHNPGIVKWLGADRTFITSVFHIKDSCTCTFHFFLWINLYTSVNTVTR